MQFSAKGVSKCVLQEDDDPCQRDANTMVQQLATQLPNRPQLMLNGPACSPDLTPLRMCGRTCRPRWMHRGAKPLII
jgi:hypothetical protein